MVTVRASASRSNTGGTASSETSTVAVDDVGERVPRPDGPHPRHRGHDRRPARRGRRAARAAHPHTRDCRPSCAPPLPLPRGRPTECRRLHRRFSMSEFGRRRRSSATLFGGACSALSRQMGEKARMVQVVRQQGPMGRRLGVLAGVLTVGLVLGACTVPGGGASPAAGGTDAPSSSAPSTSTTTTPAIPPVTLTSSVATDAKIPVDTVVSVAAKDGTVTDVTLTYKDPKKGEVNVEGNLDPNGANWTATSLLEPGTTYTLSMVGKNTAGTESTAHSTFSTQALSKKQQIYPTRRRQRRHRRRRHAGHRPVRRAGEGQGRLREEDDGQVRARAGGLVELDLQQRGALAAGELLEAGHQGLRQRRHQQRPRAATAPTDRSRPPGRSPSATRRSSRPTSGPTR